jgi:hypothetical protein
VPIHKSWRPREIELVKSPMSIGLARTGYLARRSLSEFLPRRFVQRFAAGSDDRSGSCGGGPPSLLRSYRLVKKTVTPASEVESCNATSSLPSCHCLRLRSLAQSLRPKQRRKSPTSSSSSPTISAMASWASTVVVSCAARPPRALTSWPAKACACLISTSRRSARPPGRRGRSPTGPRVNRAILRDFRAAHSREGRVHVHDVNDLVADAARRHFARPPDDERRA